MSRVGKLAVKFPSSVKVERTGDVIVVKGPKGELKTKVTGDVTVKIDNGEISVQPVNDSNRSRAMWGTVRNNLNNMVKGASEGFVKRLEINGVGFRAAVEKNILSLFLGYSHEIKYAIPAGITVKCEKPTLIEISGSDNQLIGQMCADLIRLRKPEPYKGKGIKFEGQTIRRKEGKKK